MLYAARNDWVNRMIFLEMSRDEQHGGGTWGFTNCVWAPTEKKGGGSWPFWEKVVRIREGDTIIHLRGKPPNANFVGYSTAFANGFRTIRRPPDAKEWEYAEAFYRSDLVDFTPFHKPINLNEVFKERATELEAYLEANKKRSDLDRINVFYVKQSGRLQCLNGAYLSDVDEELLTALFGDSTGLGRSDSQNLITSVETGSQISTIRTRLGQSRFADEMKKLYCNRCCFPNCEVADTRFLVASHIARWSDNEELRGKLGNGLCFCLLHDKAFEVGLFTLDEHFAVFVNPRERGLFDSKIVQDLIRHHGEGIQISQVTPLTEALLEHWIRVDIDPLIRN
jgi:hypothetical protein